MYPVARPWLTEWMGRRTGRSGRRNLRRSSRCGALRTQSCWSQSYAKTKQWADLYLSTSSPGRFPHIRWNLGKQGESCTECFTPVEVKRFHLFSSRGNPHKSLVKSNAGTEEPKTVLIRGCVTTSVNPPTLTCVILVVLYHSFDSRDCCVPSGCLFQGQGSFNWTPWMPIQHATKRPRW